METIIKKYFWVVNLLFLAIAAWLVAGSINVVIAHKLRSLPVITTPTQVQKKQARLTQEVRDNQVIVKLNLFNSAMAIPVEAVESGPDLDEASAEELADGLQSSMRAALVGTVVAQPSDWSMAIITDMNASETGIYRVGDNLMGEATVNEILPLRVYLVRNGVREYLELQDKSQKKAGNAVAQATPPPAGGSADNLGEGIKKVNDDNYIIQRGEIDKTLANLNSIAMQARIVPSFVNGEANGFKLFAIRPGSLYSKIGIQNGDIIQKINGFPMNSPDKALEIYQKLKSASSVEVELTRRGQGKKLNYQIQ
jgi:general secretion pathway protein C